MKFGKIISILCIVSKAIKYVLNLFGYCNNVSTTDKIIQSDKENK